MIHFNLICANDHEFEGWFQSGKAFDGQVKKKQVACPVCDDSKIKKALMAPAVSAKSTRAFAPANNDAVQSREARKALAAIRDTVESNCENVGNRFAEEARKIHYGEAATRGIYGEATNDEAKGLSEEGVPFSRIPWVKRGDA